MIPQQELVWLKLFFRWIFPMSNMKSVTWQLTNSHPKIPHFKVIVAHILPPNTSYGRPVKDWVICYPGLAGTRSGRGLLARETGLATTGPTEACRPPLTSHTEVTQPDSGRTQWTALIICDQKVTAPCYLWDMCMFNDYILFRNYSLKKLPCLCYFES